MFVLLVSYDVRGAVGRGQRLSSVHCGLDQLTATFSILWAGVGVIDAAERLAVRFVEDGVAISPYGPGLLSLPQ